MHSSTITSCQCSHYNRTSIVLQILRLPFFRGTTPHCTSSTAYCLRAERYYYYIWLLDISGTKKCYFRNTALPSNQGRISPRCVREGPSTSTPGCPTREYLEYPGTSRIPTYTVPAAGAAPRSKSDLSQGSEIRGDDFYIVLADVLIGYLLNRHRYFPCFT